MSGGVGGQGLATPSYPVFDEGIESGEECGLDSLFIQMGRMALLISRKFAVALPDGPAVLGGGVPGLGAIIVTAVSANDMGCQYTLAAISSGKGAPALDL